MENTVTVLILASIFVHGEMLKKGERVEVHEREATELERRGVATRDLEGSENVSHNYNEMTLEELGEVDYMKLHKDPLVNFAKACGLEITAESKNDIYGLLESVDFEAEEEQE